MKGIMENAITIPFMPIIVGIIIQTIDITHILAGIIIHIMSIRLIGKLTEVTPVREMDFTVGVHQDKMGFLAVLVNFVEVNKILT
jgi:hypothetical protein